jgi:DNA-binding MarR family transcriptional regulator
MTQPKKPNLPIGFWLKKVDQLLTEQIDEIQASNGVSRLEWQALNTLFETGGASQEELHDILATFTDFDSLGSILSRFSQLGWVDSLEGEGNTVRYQLNDIGQRKHDVVLQAQQEARQLVMKGITQEDYATVMRVLQQVVTNIEGESRKASQN